MHRRRPAGRYVRLMSDQPAYILDIDSLEDVTVSAAEIRQVGRRRWLGVRFDCCRVYHRVYKNAAGNAYAGRCPKCYREVTILVGPAGTSSRFFRAE